MRIRALKRALDSYDESTGEYGHVEETWLNLSDDKAYRVVEEVEKNPREFGYPADFQRFGGSVFCNLVDLNIDDITDDMIRPYDRVVVDSSMTLEEFRRVVANSRHVFIAYEDGTFGEKFGKLIGDQE